MEDSSNVIKNDIKEVHRELVRISQSFEELIDRVQRNHEEYIYQLKIINMDIRKAMQNQVNPTPSKALGGQGGEEIIFCDKPKIFNSAKKTPP